MTKHFFSLLLLLSGLCSLSAQIITVTPAFPTADDTVEIVYNAALGNAALVGATPVYVHTGLITNLSANNADWQHVQLLPWPTNAAKLLMTDLGNNLHKIKFHIRSYYSLPLNETATKMAFVFRNGAGTVVGKDASGSDIFYDLYAAGSQQLSLSSPQNGDIYNVNDMVNITANSSSAANINLYVDGNLVQNGTGVTNLSYNYPVLTAGQHWIKATAGALADSVYILGQGTTQVQNAPAGTQFGINYLTPSSVRLALSTPVPDKAYVYAIGDFSNWLPLSAYEMKNSTDGKMWWVDIPNLTAGQEYAYQFLVKNDAGTVIKIADPYCEKVLDPWNDSYISASIYPNLKPYPLGQTGIVSVFQTNMPAYNWQVANFQAPKQTDLIVHELLLRDFSKRHSFQALIDTLFYLKDLGVNAIQLMPVMEFEGNSSWGYNPSFMFATDKYYGTRNKLKELVDVCHQNGIAVIFDIVLNHQFGQSPMAQLYWDAANSKPAANSPWFNADATHPFNVGYDLNHDAPETRAFVDRVVKYWIQEYHGDGFRFDLSKGFTQTNSGGNIGLWGQYDASRVYNIERMGDLIWTYAPNSYLILEHFADNSEETVLANHGFMLWGNHNYSYNEATMGYIPNSDFGGISYKNRNWNNPKLVGYMESHDEERLMAKNLAYGNSNGTYNTKSLNTALDRMAEAQAFFATIPGPKMNWMFGELGYDVAEAVPCALCEKPVLWNYFNVAKRKQLYLINAALNKLRVTEDAFESTDFYLDVSNSIKRIEVNHASMNVNVVGNFGVTAWTGDVYFKSNGKWYDYFSGDSISVSNNLRNMTLQAGEYHVYTTKKLITPNTDPTVGIENDLKNSAFYHFTYPNPSSGESHIVFSTKTTGQATIRIYNTMGQLVAMPMQNETVTALQLQEVIWENENMPSGTYFYQIAIDGKGAVGKIVKE